MTEREKLALLEDLFETEEGELSADTSLEDVDGYDSMTRLSLIVMMEDEFGVHLEGTEIKSFKTIGDILNKMNK